MHHSPVRSILSGVALLLATAPASAQIRVALCGAAQSTNTACQWVDVQTRLLATNQFATVDIINVTTTGGGTPPLTQLLGYDALLCWTNTAPANNQTWGDVLADYVDAGGGVVVAVFANSIASATLHIGGRWQTGYEVILDQSGTTTGASSLGSVLVPSHPVMNGVTTFVSGSTGGRPTGTVLEVGANPIALWADGKILIAEGANPQRIDLGFYPPHSTCNAFGWTTGGDLLMANALQYVARGASYHPFGSGCAGTQGVPNLHATAGSRPILGTTFSATVDNLPVGVAIMLMGFSDAHYGAIPLPLDLSPFGLTGCNLLAAPLTNQFIVGPPTSAAWTLAIPNLTTIQGLMFYNQGIAIDPGANPAGLTVSNGAKGKLGL